MTIRRWIWWASRIDAAIRSHMLLEQDTHAIAIGPELGMSLVASPAYLDRHGTPKAHGDLSAHEGICFAFGNSDRLAPWSFLGDEGAFSVMPRPRMIVNDLASMLQYVEAGLGLAYIYAETARHLVERGETDQPVRRSDPFSPTVHRQLFEQAPYARSAEGLHRSCKSYEMTAWGQSFA